MTLSPFVKSSLIGMGIGAGAGMVPGIFSALVGSLLSFVQASVHTQNASSLVIYLGILIGGAAGAVVGALGADEAGSDMDAAPMAEQVKQ